MNILVEGKTPQVAATKANLDSWIAHVPIPYTSTLDSVDPQPGLEAFFDVARDQFIIIELKTMTVVDILAADPMGAVGEVEGMLPPVDGGT